MNELDFREWLTTMNVPRKVQSDLVSRLKKLQRELNNCDLDECYKQDKCVDLFRIFDNKGINKAMAEYQTARLPIGKYHLSAYKYALRKYVEFLATTTKN